MTEAIVEDTEIMFPEDEPESPFGESDDTTTSQQRLHYYALCWLKADRERPLDKAQMSKCITELGQDTIGRRFPHMTWEQDTVKKLAELLNKLRKSKVR